MLTSTGASTASRATLRNVKTSYCGSCIKVHRKDWGKGTKKVKPFAYTRVKNWSIKLSGLIHLWAGWLLPSKQAAPNMSQALLQEEDQNYSATHHPQPLTGWVFPQKMAKFQTCASSTHWNGAFHKGSVPSGMSLGSFWLCLFFTLQLPPLPQGKLNTQHKSIPGSRLLLKSCSGTVLSCTGDNPLLLC